MTAAALSAGEAVRKRTAELLARDAWPRERLLALQRERLRELLRHAVTASPYYRETLGASALDEDVDLGALPVLRKPVLVEELDRIVTDPRLTRARLGEALDAALAGAPFLGEYRVFTTSGTTGAPGVTFFSRDEFAEWTAVNLRAVARTGVTPATRLATVGAPSPLHLSRQIFEVFRSGRTGAPELAVTDPLPTLAAALQEYEPEAIATYPSIAALLAEEQLAGRLSIAPKLLLLGSEVLTTDAEQRIADAWGIAAHQAYVTTEVPMVASGSPERVGLHVCEDAVIVEVIDEHGRPVAPGAPGDRVLLTNLVNRAQPLIRYELTDSLVLAPGADPSGRPYLRIASVEGRSDDIVRLAAPGGGEVAVHPSRLRAPFSTLLDVRQWRIDYDGVRLRVRVVPREDAPRDVPARVEAAIRRALEEAGAVPPPTTVELATSIPREAGHAAKYKLIEVRGRA